MISTRVLETRLMAFCFNEPKMRSTVPSANPTPAQRCRLHPPMAAAAMPVDAVIHILDLLPSMPLRKYWIISRSSSDLPVPAAAVSEREPALPRTGPTSATSEENVEPGNNGVEHLLLLKAKSNLLHQRRGGSPKVGGGWGCGAGAWAGGKGNDG